MNIKEFTKEIEKLNRLQGDFKEYVAFNEVLYLIKQLDEPQKVVIPKFVADWINKCKVFEHIVSLSFALNPVSWEENRLSDECIDWLKSTSNQEVFARAWLDGYEVEEEKRYLVKMKGISSNMCYLNRVGNKWIIAEIDEHTGMNIYTKHTRKELEEAGFGWMFDCPGIEVEEVE